MSTQWNGHRFEFYGIEICQVVIRNCTFSEMHWKIIIIFQIKWWTGWHYYNSILWRAKHSHIFVGISIMRRVFITHIDVYASDGAIYTLSISNMYTELFDVRDLLFIIVLRVFYWGSRVLNQYWSSKIITRNVISKGFSIWMCPTERTRIFIVIDHPSNVVLAHRSQYTSRTFHSALSTSFKLIRPFIIVKMEFFSVAMRHSVRWLDWLQMYKMIKTRWFCFPNFQFDEES